MTERETCNYCIGTGVLGYSYSDFTCPECNGAGGVMTEREELKPCPFCGNEDVTYWGEYIRSRPVKCMYCTECHAQGPRVMLDRNEEESDWLSRAIAAWNRRDEG